MPMLKCAQFPYLVRMSKLLAKLQILSFQFANKG